MIITTNNLPTARRQDLEPPNSGLSWIKITSKSESTLLGTYRPPTSNDDHKQLEHSLNTVASHTKVVLCGDFNSPNIDWTTTSSNSSYKPSIALCEIVQDASWQPCQSLSLTSMSQTTYSTVIIKQFTSKSTSTSHSNITPFYGLQLQKGNFNYFRELLSYIIWHTCFMTNSVDDVWTTFKDQLLSAADECIPQITIRKTKRLKNWLSDTLKAICNKYRVFIRGKHTNLAGDISRYHTIRRKAKYLTRSDHRNHIEEMTSTIEHNPKTFSNWISLI